MAPASALDQHLERKNERTPSGPMLISKKSAPQFTRTVTGNARRKEVLLSEIPSFPALEIVRH